MAHLDTPLKTQLLDLTGLELLELSDRPGFVGEQVELGFSVPGDLDGAVVNPVMDPVDRYVQAVGYLGHGQVARDVARVRATPPGQLPMPQPDVPHRAGSQDVPPGRTVPLPGQPRSDLLISHPLPGERKDLFLHLREARQLPEGSQRR